MVVSLNLLLLLCDFPLCGCIVVEKNGQTYIRLLFLFLGIFIHLFCMKFVFCFAFTDLTEHPTTQVGLMVKSTCFLFGDHMFEPEPGARCI